MNRDSQWSKQDACFARATQALLAVNHYINVTSDECIRCSKGIAQVSLTAANQIYVFHEAMNESKNLKIH